MLIAYNDDGMMQSLNGFRFGYTKEMIDELWDIKVCEHVRIYDAETIDRVWMAFDTGGTVRIGFSDGEPVIVTENGNLEPPTDEPAELPKPQPSPIELLQQENELLKLQNKALSDRADFMEDLIAEIAMQVYP